MSAIEAVRSWLLRLVFWCWNLRNENRAFLYKVRSQVDAYFDRWHYALDSHILRDIDEEGFTPFKVILGFPRMQALGATEEILREALWCSEQIIFNKTLSGMKPRWPVAEWPKDRLQYSKMRLKDLPLTADRDQVELWLKKLGIRAFRVSLYNNEDGSFNGSGHFMAESIEVADRLHTRYAVEKPLWNENFVLIERDQKHAKSRVPGTPPVYAPGRQPVDGDGVGALSFEHHQFINNCKNMHFPFVWREVEPYMERKVDSVAPGGPFRTIISISPHSELPGVKRQMVFESPYCTRKKECQRLAEFKVARYLFHILCPERDHPYPLPSDEIPKNEQEKNLAIERLSRLNEVKRLRNIYREIDPNNMNYYIELPGMLGACIGKLRPWTVKESNAFEKLLGTLPIREPLNELSKQRAALLNNRGYSDFVKPLIPEPVAPSKDNDSSDGESSDEDTSQKDVDDEKADISALEALELLIPASLFQIGFLESPREMRVLWQTRTQLFIAIEEVTPRLNILWTRHTVRFQFRNLLRNISKPIWIESDLGAPELKATGDEFAENSPDSPPPSPCSGATYLDLFIPVDSVPRLSRQEHFQNHKVGSPDFTLNHDLASMTIMRLHFDLTTIAQEDFVRLMLALKSLIELGLAKTRFGTNSTVYLPVSAPTDSYPVDAKQKGRTNILGEKEAEYKPPMSLIYVDHWVRWKLACLSSSNLIRLAQISETVVATLLSYSRTICFRVLEKMEAKRERAFSFEQDLICELSRYPKAEHMSGEHFALKKDFVLVPHVTVTPWEIRCEGPLPEISNRLLRHYAPLQERFMRLSFRSGYMGGTNGTSMRNVGKMTVRTRCGGILSDGLVLPWVKALFETPYRLYETAVRHSTEVPLKPPSETDYRFYSKFEFLVSSPSQLRTQKAWMYCMPYEAPPGFSLPIAVPEMRKWLGDFDKIYNVAMFSARLGQGLSSTFHCFDVDPTWIERVPDVTTEKYCFSDGCGSISPSIAKRAADALGLSFVPSAFQIRLSGIKGMVSVDTRLEGDVIRVRPSMEKFSSSHLGFEVVTWTRPLAAHLNKQIIQILSALGLPDQNLIDVQTAAFEKIAASAFPPSFASDEARSKHIDGLEQKWGSKALKGGLETRALAMLRAGFDPTCEPYLKSVLTSIQLRSLQDIHSMARIPINNGRYAIGIMDEYGVLEEGQVYFKTTGASTSSHHVHTGLLCVSRSPCLHPGDARFVNAVDIPELSHLTDVLVFPRRGARPIPDECSGGDLDGDQYLVLWGDEFIPPKRDTPAFDHESSSEASKAAKDDNEVYPHELVDFFVNYIFDDKLSTVADAHTYWADRSELGVFDEKCLKLAAAHNIAVDAPKTGKTVPAMDEFRIGSWPDFMNVNKASYLSNKVLGILFRRSGEEFSSIASWSKSEDETSSKTKLFDTDLVLEGSEAYLQEAAEIRDEYFHQLCTNMQLFGITDEGSAITGEALYRFRSERREWENKKEGYEFTSTELRSRLRATFFQTQPQELSSLSSSELTHEQLLRASAWYQVTYDPKLRSAAKLSMWSFPWNIDDVLCEIKRRAVLKRKEQSQKDEIQSSLPEPSDAAADQEINPSFNQVQPLLETGADPSLVAVAPTLEPTLEPTPLLAPISPVGV